MKIMSPFFFFSLLKIFGLLRAYAKYQITKNIINPIISLPQLLKIDYLINQAVESVTPGTKFVNILV